MAPHGPWVQPLLEASLSAIEELYSLEVQKQGDQSCLNQTAQFDLTSSSLLAVIVLA